MWSPSRRRLIKLLSLAVIGVLGFWNIYQVEAQAVTASDYILVNSNLTITVEPDTTTPVVVGIRNLTGQVWTPETLRLGTIFPTGDSDRPSVWRTDTWLSSTRVSLTAGNQPIRPNQVAVFSFTMKAPSYRGIYQESFMPLLEGERWLVGNPITLTFQVGEELLIQETTSDKEIRIYRDTQQANWLENGIVIATLPVSSGKSGYTTPAGNYRIINQFEEAYSSKYSLYMGHWKGLAKEGVGFAGYGMHSLAYWKIKNQPYPDGTIYNGRLYINHRVYEDVEHLGEPMSHGCIRFGINEARVMYDWAPIGTAVVVV